MATPGGVQCPAYVVVLGALLKFWGDSLQGQLVDDLRE